MAPISSLFLMEIWYRFRLVPDCGVDIGYKLQQSFILFVLILF